MLINLRNALMAGKRNPTAKDYPTLPDVFFFDAIENSGYKTHDATAATWKNLVATNNLTLTGGRSWLDDALYLDGTGGAKNDNWTTSPSTVEFVCTPERSSTTEILFGTGDPNMFGVKGNGGGMVFNVNYAVPGVFTDLPRTFAVAFTSDSRAYINGVATATVAGATFNYMYMRVEVGRRYTGTANYFKGKVHAYRAHSRALTADEIAANYAVDKARFGLP